MKRFDSSNFSSASPAKERIAPANQRAGTSHCGWRKDRSCQHASKKGAHIQDKAVGIPELLQNQRKSPDSL
jgi:hypothetical protein